MKDNRLLSRIAELYYINDVSQYEIAKKFNFSKAKVCRIIKEAKRKNIIQFSIKRHHQRLTELEKELEDKYNLREAIISDNMKHEGYSEELAYHDIGLIGAKYIERILKNDLNIALSWGRTLYSIINNLNADKKYKINIFATVGGFDQGDIETQNNNLLRLFSQKIGGKTHPIFMPIILRNTNMKDALIKEQALNKIIKDPQIVDYYFASVGQISKNSSLYNGRGEFNQKLLSELQNKKICGEVGLNFYDINGNFLKSGLEDRTIYIDINEIKRMKNIVIVGFGKDKIKPLIGILRTGIVNVLITNSDTAQSLIGKK